MKSHRFKQLLLVSSIIMTIIVLLLWLGLRFLFGPPIEINRKILSPSGIYEADISIQKGPAFTGYVSSVSIKKRGFSLPPWKKMVFYARETQQIDLRWESDQSLTIHARSDPIDVIDQASNFGNVRIHCVFEGRNKIRGRN